MAEFTVSLSGLTAAAAEIRTQSEAFRTSGDDLKSASEQLTTSSDGWMSEAATEFNERIVELHTWISDMCEIINEYSAALDKAEELYRTADESAAKNFQ